MKKQILLLSLLLISPRAARPAEINGSLTLARITAPSAPATNFSTLSVNVTTATIGCINADSTNCFNVNLSGTAAPTLPATTTFYVIGASSGSSRTLGIAYAGTAFHTGARFDGTPASPTAVQATEQIAGYNAFGYDGTTLGGPLASVRVFANQNFTASAHGSYMDFTTTPNGTTASAVVMRLEADAGVTVPNTVTGGDKGAGTINAGGLFVNGVAVNTSSGLTIGTTTISGGGTNAILYGDGTNLQNETAVTRSAASQFTFSRAAVGTTPFDSIILTNPTAAAAGLQQESPAYNRCGFGWKTTATAASQSVCVRDYLLPVQGTTAPSGKINWDISVNGGSYVTVFSVAPTASLDGTGTTFILDSLSVLNAASNFLNVSGGAGNMTFKMNGASGISTYGPTSAGFGNTGKVTFSNSTDGTGTNTTSIFQISGGGGIGIGKGSTVANGLLNLAGATFLDPTATTGATRILVSLGAADSTTTVTLNNAGTTTSVGVIVSGQPATTGQRFACLTTTGQIVSSATACVGT